MRRLRPTVVYGIFEGSASLLELPLAFGQQSRSIKKTNCECKQFEGLCKNYLSVTCQDTGMVSKAI